jgi:hypothetical protein
MVKIPLIIAKPALKKFRKLVEDRNKTSRKLNKKGGSFKNLNTAQQRLDSAKEYTSGVMNLLKKKAGEKAPAGALKMLRKGFDEVIKKRKEFRDAVAESTAKRLKGRKPNFKGGLIRKPKLAKRGF